MSGYAEWNPSTTYILDNLVFFDGVIYICIQAPNFNRQPNSNPSWWATNGGGSSITSIVGGAGIGVSGSTAITITNTGVRTLTSGGTGITIGGTTTDRTVSNTGVLSLTAGTNITLGGTAQNPVINSAVDGIQTITAGTNITLTGTATDPIINSAVDGVQTLTAGANVSITGTTANPIISATSSPLPTPQTPRDFAGASTITITSAQMANAVFYSSVSYSTGTITVNLPSYADMLATYGAQKLVPFYWGNINIGSGQLVNINLSTLGNANLIWVNVPIQGNSAPVSLQNYFSGHPTPFALPTLQIWNGTAYIDDVSGTVSYNFAWAGFAN
jgi:hypothetical protein